MKSQDYWKSRFELLEQAQNQKGIDYYHSIERQYRQAANEVEKEIVKWYSRFATENGISMSEAKRLLNSRELAEFRWDVKEYIKHGEQLGLDNTWMKQLENASARVHVSRLEALKVQIQQRAEVVMGNELDGLDKLAREVFTDGYYHTAFEIQKGFGVGWDLMKLDTRRIDKVISKPWAADGMNFSQRIWRDRAQLVNELHAQLTQTIITGGSPETAVKALSKRFDVSKAKARRLVMTESAFFASAAQQDCFNDLDVEKYEIVATLDLKTSPTCRSLDGKVFPMSEYKVGITAPPFHQYCRTVTVPWFEDNEIAERAARGADGKTYYVKGDMKYPDWYNSFVDGGSKEGLTDFVSNVVNSEEAFPTNKDGERIKFEGRFDKNGESYKKEYEAAVIQPISELSNEYNTRLKVVTGGADKAAGMVDMMGQTMQLNSIHHRTVYHEFAHTLTNTDALKLGLVDDNDFWKEIRKVRSDYKKAIFNNPKISISSYANSGANGAEKIDEFFAEAFAHAKMRQRGLPIPDEYGDDFTFSQRVLDITDKYFKKAKSFKTAKTHDDLITIAKDRWKVKTFDDSFKDLDFETMKGTFAEMDKVYERFPELKGTVHKYSAGESGWAATAKTEKGSIMSFNGSSYGKNGIEGYKKDYADSVISHFHPKGTNYYSTGVHELGHSVEAIIIDKLEYHPSLAIEVWNDCEMAQGIISEACKLAKKTPLGKGLRNADLIRQISRYATYSKSETMAEAFADYFANGDEAAILSQKIIEVTERWLKE